MFDTTAIGKKIKHARIDKNMTQMALADAMGVSYQAVSNWERGNSMPDISKLGDLCTALDITVNELLGIEAPAVTKAMENEELTMEELTEVAPVLLPEDVKVRMQDHCLHISVGDVKVKIEDTDESGTSQQKESGEDSKADLIGPDINFLGGMKVKIETAEAEKAQSKTKRKKIGLSRIAELAPFLDEEYLSELVLEAVEVSLDGIEDVADYVGGEVLEQVVEKARQEDLTELVEIACYLSEKALERLVERIGLHDLDEIADVACYMGEQSLDKLVRRCEEAGEFDVITEIACYLSEETLDGLVDRLIEKKFDSEDLDISDLYSYLGEKTLRKLAKYLMEQKDLDALEELIPFV